MATATYDTDSGAPSEPVTVSTFWSTLLSVGGLMFLAGSLGFATVQMRIYEERIATLQAALVPSGVTPAEPAIDSVPAEPVAQATPEDEPVSSDPRIAELETQLLQLGEELGIARDNLAGAEETIIGLTSELEACRGQIANPNSRLREMIEENRRLRGEVAELRQNCPPNRGEVFR